MSKPPAFQFYADDFIAGTSDMTNEEVGVYVRLLCYQWSKGAIPSDTDRLNLICCGNAKPHAIAKFGLCEDGMLRNERMEKERSKQAAFREKQAENGKKRWLGNAKPVPSLMPNACSPSPSPSPNNNTLSPSALNELRLELEADFAADPKPIQVALIPAPKRYLDKEAGAIYDEYPLKVGRPKAIAAIRKALASVTFEFLLDATRQYARVRSTMDRGLTPHPTTWFNAHRFNDDPETWKDRVIVVPDRTKTPPAPAKVVKQLGQLFHDFVKFQNNPALTQNAAKWRVESDLPTSIRDDFAAYKSTLA